MRSLQILVLFLMASPGLSVAQDWRSIKPLHSTCEDVKRVLGVDKCEYPVSTYRLENETVTISFVMCPCPLSCYHQGSGWNVPAGTVGSVRRQLRKPLPIASFAIDDKWKKFETDFIGELIYDNYEQGMSLSAVNGEVVNVTYYAPLDKNKDLLCPKCSVTPPPNAEKETTLSSWFNGYGDIPFDEERMRLDKFAIKLKESSADFLGYIVAYADCRSVKGDAKRKADRAKQYLVGVLGIDGTRIVTIDGGQQEEVLVELHIRQRSLPPPPVFSSIYPNRSNKH